MLVGGGEPLFCGMLACEWGSGRFRILTGIEGDDSAVGGELVVLGVVEASLGLLGE